MAYSELIKNFNKIREYMREFYVYGFKSREEYNKKSARSYDDERRRMESWLGENMQFRQNAEGKNVFISIDSRASQNNPLYKAWKTKSFTDGDITLHFSLFDILSEPEISMSLKEIMGEIDEIISEFENPRYFDESTVRKKIKEYVEEGLLVSEKHGKTMYYRRTEDVSMCDSDTLDFFSEVAPCGVVGSFLLDKKLCHNKHLVFKHHYITSAMDSEILQMLFDAMNQKKNITLESINRKKDRVSENQVVPLRIMISVQNGRQYLMAFAPRLKRITSYRIDNIVSVKLGETCERFDELRNTFNKMLPNIWGVSTQSESGQRMEHVEFTVSYDKDEQFIHNRLEREKRCGKVERISENESKFSADVYDTSEMIPWIRTFICRITEINFSNKELEKKFFDDMEAMYKLYDLEGGEMK
ncbi:MAG: WYL domain-containing protein [Lachnospiraceae bacterium]|nr:WYL domain-containing protein [Lachnospiraceae bacterium]